MAFLKPKQCEVILKLDGREFRISVTDFNWRFRATDVLRVELSGMVMDELTTDPTLSPLVPLRKLKRRHGEPTAG